MAKIVINEISQNYAYNIGTNSYATVALPITSSWGPGYFSSEAYPDTDDEDMLEACAWSRFPATQAGLEAFVSTYRGPSSNYRLVNDYSYQIAMTLISAGYDVLTCRICPGTPASAQFVQKGVDPASAPTLTVQAKYPGTFGDSLEVYFKQVPRKLADGSTQFYTNMIVYVADGSGSRTAVENKVFVFQLQNATDSILYIDEIESNFVKLSVNGTFTDSDFELECTDLTNKTNKLSGGSDRLAEDAGAMAKAIEYATARYSWVETDSCEYLNALATVPTTDPIIGENMRHREWLFNAAFKLYDMLTDKLSYNPNRIISPGWDDQDFNYLISNGGYATITPDSFVISPLHSKLMDVAYLSRCATAYIDVPRSLPRKYVYDDATQDVTGYAQLLSQRYVQDPLYSTHSALFAPWGQYQYVGTSRQAIASPSFQALLIQRSQILNQAAQYEWALPTNRKHNVRLGKLDYTVTKKYLDTWQSQEGVGVNAITAIPDLGLNIWGNSTLFDIPPATYQALSNLSTRLLVNAVEDVAYRCGLSITFQYNNSQAYNKFYAGCTPILDTMVNVGAIEGYRVEMGADIDGLDQINANSVIGKIYLVVNGVINDIYIDLVCLPTMEALNSTI